MKSIELFNAMDGYTFDEGIAFLVLVKAPLGVINYLKSTHNRNHLHAEIHKQLRLPSVRQTLKKKGYGIAPKPAPIEQKPAEIEPKPTEIEPKPTEIEQKPAEIEPKPEDDDSDIILSKEDVLKHENTRLEDMPNELCRSLWLKRQDVWRELQQAHLKMRSVPEGEEHNQERAKWREEVLRLDAENDSYWQQIDEEVARFEAEKENPSEEKPEEKPGFDVSTYRSYISRALRKQKLTPAQLAEVQHRVDEMIAAKIEIKEETLDRLKAVGVKVG